MALITFSWADPMSLYVLLASEACPATVVVNTMQDSNTIPLTVNGRNVPVTCVSGKMLTPGGDSSYTATCVDGAWDKAYSCGKNCTVSVHVVRVVLSLFMW